MGSFYLMHNKIIDKNDFLFNYFENNRKIVYLFKYFLKTL